MDRGVWWATVHRISKSWTWLKWLSMQDPALGSTGSMAGLMVTCKKTYAKGHLPGLLLLVQQWTTAGPCLHRRLSVLAGRSGSVSCGITVPFSWVLACAKFCSCPPRVESLFPPVLWKCCNQIPPAFKVRFPGESQSLCGIPRLGSLKWGSGRTSLVLLFSSLWAAHLACMGFDFIMFVPLLPCHCSFFLSLEVGYLFLMGSSILLSMVVQQLVVILVLSQEEMSACPLLCHLELEAPS